MVLLQDGLPATFTPFGGVSGQRSRANYRCAWLPEFTAHFTATGPLAAFFQLRLAHIRMAARDPFAEYPAADRIADFRDTIYKDIDWLDVQFLRFVDGLK